MLASYSCKREIKSRQYIIDNELAYPMPLDKVLKKIGQPDSITTKKSGMTALGVHTIQVYHYGKDQIFFNVHGTFLGVH